MKLKFLFLFLAATPVLYAQKFTEVPQSGGPFEGVSRSSIAFADVDGDGDPDVLISGSGSSERISTLYTNDGSGTYTEVAGTPFEGVWGSSIAFVDVDGDADPDVLITGGNNSGVYISKLYTNDGSGHFTEVTGTPFEGVWRSSIAFADVDGDGDPDVLLTGRNNSLEGISKLYTNDGMGTYTEVAGAPFEGVWDSSIAFADVDGDGDPDVLLTGQNNSFEGISKLYTNDGSGNYTEVTGTPFEDVGYSSIAFADVDGDADPDVLITGGNNSFEGISKLYTNDGSGNYTEVTGTPYEDVGYSSIAFADVDGDGDPDVLLTGQNNSFEGISKLYTNDGTGTFTELAGTPFESVWRSSIAFADVDGDADPDVLITGESNSLEKISKLYTNDGTGTFTELAGTPFEGVSSGSIAFADVDGDADPDVLITGENNSFEGISTLYTNDGSGNYTEVAGTPFESVWRSSIAFADVDGDADPDVLITGENNSLEEISKLYTNDGSGTYTEVTDTPFEGVWHSSIAFADVDGDADPDVLITGGNNSFERISKLYTNDGSGTYTEVTDTPFEGVFRSSIAFADVDGDGEPDVLITGQNNSPALISKLYTNDGTVSSSGDLTADVRLNLTLFPNPAMSTGLNISFHSTESTAVMVRIYDLKGRLIRQQKEMAGTGAQTLLVDITSLSAGSYFIQLENGKQSGVAKFIVP